MKRLLPLALIVAVWPVGLIALAAASTGRDSRSTNDEVTVPSNTQTPGAAPKTTVVPLKVDGKTHYCPLGTRKKLEPIDQRLGQLELELTPVRRESAAAVRRLKELDKLYPGKNAPTQAIADEYNGLLRKMRQLEARESRLINAYNNAVDEHNNVLDQDCN